MNMKCIKELTVEYADLSGTCADKCCGGLYLGEQDFTFEVGFEYELERDSYNGWYHELDNYNKVYIPQIEEYFEEING